MRRVVHITIDYTTLSSWRRCPTSFRYRYLEALSKVSIREDEVSPDKGSPLEFGRMIHLALEKWHSGQHTASEVIDALLMEGAATSLVKVNPEGSRNLPHLVDLFSAYVRRYPQPHGDFTPLEIDGKQTLEHAYEIKLSDRITWKGHFDCLATSADGNVVVEHKTASGDPRASFSDRMLPNAQAVGYSYGAATLLGQPTVPVLFNGLTTDRNQISEIWRAEHAKKAHHKNYRPPYDPFLRSLIRITPAHHAEWRESVIRDVTRLIEDIEANSFSSNAPDACTVFNRRCAFDDLCKFTADERALQREFHYEQIEPWKGFRCQFEDGTMIGLTPAVSDKS